MLVRECQNIQYSLVEDSFTTLTWAREPCLEQETWKSLPKARQRWDYYVGVIMFTSKSSLVTPWGV